MPSLSKDSSDWLIGKLQNAVKTFDDSTTSLLQGQQKAFDLCCELLRSDAQTVETKSKSTRSLRLRARQLLKDVFQSLGAEVFLLCTVGTTVTNLGENALHIRLSKIQIWWDSTSRPRGLATVAKQLCEAEAIGSSAVLSRKRQCWEGQLSKRLQIEPDGLPQNVHHTPAQGSGAGVQQENPKIPSIHSNQSTAQEQLVLENASLQGIEKVFDGKLCNAIRRVTVDGESKAAITMVFPSWVGLVDCLMSLDICERDISQLAMALFHAEVKWVQHILHVVLENGMTLTTETSEVILKGVEDDAINKVFGPEIHGAINECLVRRRETRRATECVSMIFTKNGAFISLSLGIRAGLQIQNKLCT
ncbi:hypothetical protein BCR34DRAFT_499290 [Clohesyomyces aquaticus]|uniref:Uncharacterized protein n=1 Tax=Clohesyomyces aquaticus TaxID=1231657 RepID=A0A1Y1Y8P8_9PLEO|nr:hypothetical protein BCR34DRAFT_499290 [Clohesyomyces aquaticus]